MGSGDRGPEVALTVPENVTGPLPAFKRANHLGGTEGAITEYIRRCRARGRVRLLPGWIMSKTVVAMLAILAAASAAEAQTAAAAYAPGVHRYRVTREARSSQEVMGTVQTGTVTTVEELTFDLRAAALDTMRFSFTIDSASRQSDMPGASEAPPAKGRRVSGRVSPRGLVIDFDPDSSGAEDISAGYRNFLPYLPAQPLAAGMAWADTVRTPFTQAGIQGMTMTIIASRVVGDTTIGGQKAWRLERTGTLSMSGTGNQDGADLILTGAGTATGVSHITAGGVYLGANSTQELSIKVEVPAASMTIPIKQTAVTRIERIGPAAGR